MKLAYLLAGLLIIAACAPVPGPSQPTETSTSLSPLNSADEYKELFSSSSGEMYYAANTMMRSVGVMEEAAMDSAATPTAAPQAVGTDGDFSETNVQVQGIDESDMIKTDGEYIYTISGQQVFILKASPGEDAEELSDIKEKDFNPQSLFIDEDRLVVLGSEYNYAGPISILPRYGHSVVRVYDISDREDPQLLETYRFEGNLQQARLKDGYVYVATTQYSWYGVPELPVIARGDEATRIAPSSIWRYPGSYDNPVTTLVSSFAVQDLDDPESVAVVTEGGVTLYMSHDNIYLASTKTVNTWQIRQEITIDLIEDELSTEEQNLIARIRATDEDILSEQEKQSKILGIISQYVQTLPRSEQDQLEKSIERAYEQRLNSYDYLEHTLLSRIVYEDGNMWAVADGQVPGSVYSQFAMDEREGVLRIATTVSQRWEIEDSESQNIVTTLDEDLELLDQVTGIAKTERIFAARYTEDRLYLVTFRQVDPFFTIDLSNPEDIQILGELKIPGFSRYLHPFGDDLVLGIGRDATLEGRQEGLKLSIFDASDVENPVELATWKADDSYGSSSAEYDHHAITFSPSKDLLVIPYNAYNWEEKDERFQGVLVLKVTDDDIDLKGRISHDEESYWRNTIERSLWIGDELFTKSYNQVQVHDLDTLEHINTVELDVDEEEYDYPIMYDDVAIGMPMVR